MYTVQRHYLYSRCYAAIPSQSYCLFVFEKEREQGRGRERERERERETGSEAGSVLTAERPKGA